MVMAFGLKSNPLCGASAQARHKVSALNALNYRITLSHFTMLAAKTELQLKQLGPNSGHGRTTFQRL